MDAYGTTDPRTLGWFRVVLGFLCCADLLRHWGAARIFYANSGVLTNHYNLWRPASGYHFSAFHAFSSIEEVHVAFALAFVCHFLFFIGYRTRLFNALSFLIVTSLDSRLVLIENGGYVVVNVLLAWSMFMPTDKRFSVDAWLRTYRERKERSVTELNERYRPDWKYAPYTSRMVALAVINVGFVYFFNVVNKSGPIWRSGQTVHYVVWLNRMATGLAVLFRALPYWATVLCTWIVLVHEALLVVWILSPKAKRITRPLGMVGMWILHLIFGTFFRLGPFAWFMVGWSFMLPMKDNWDWLEGWYTKRAKRRVVMLDGTSPMGLAIGRAIARLDALELLSFEASELGPLLEVRDPETGERFRGSDAVWQIVQALPAGRYATPIFKVLSLGLVGPIGRYIATNRASLSRFFALTLPPRGREERDAPSPLVARYRRARTWLREAVVLYLAVAAVDQAIIENKCIPPVIQTKMAEWRPHFVEATIVYPRLFQGWGMFAPNPITDDGSVTVEAWTIDGRRIDPFTGKEPDLVLTDAEGLALPQITQDYFNRIRLDRNKVFRPQLEEWLRRYHLETGNPNDELVAFDVYWVRAQCPAATEPIHVPLPFLDPWVKRLHIESGPVVFEIPRLSSPPGDGKMYKNETIALSTWRKPGFKQPEGKPLIPPQPKIESAGN